MCCHFRKDENFGIWQPTRMAINTPALFYGYPEFKEDGGWVNIVNCKTNFHNKIV